MINMFKKWLFGLRWSCSKKKWDYLVEFESKWRFTRNRIKFQNFLGFVSYIIVFLFLIVKKKIPFMFSVIHNSPTYLWNQAIVLVPSRRSCCPTVGCGDCNPWAVAPSCVRSGTKLYLKGTLRRASTPSPILLLSLTGLSVLIFITFAKVITYIIKKKKRAMFLLCFGHEQILSFH